MSSSRWKTHGLAVALATAVALFASFTSTGHHLEGLLPDWTSRLIAETDRVNSVAVVAIDAATLDEHGPWPWQRDTLARVVQRLQQFSPKTIGFMLPVSEAETASGIGAMRDGLDSLDKPLRKQARAWLQQLDTDSQLARAIKDSGNIVLAVPYVTGNTHRPLPQDLQHFTVSTQPEELPWHRAALRLLCSAWTWTDIAIDPPLPMFLDSAAGIGVSAAYSDRQRIQGTPLAIRVADRYLPAFELSLLGAARGIETGEFSVSPGTPVRGAGQEEIGTADLSYYPRPAAAPPVYSLKDVMAGDVQKGDLRNKVVLLGLSAPGLAPELSGPAGRAYTPLTWSAQVLDGMLNGQSFTKPAWFYGAQRGLLVLLALYLMLLPVTWHGVRGLISSGLLAVILLNTGLLTLLIRDLWLPVIGPALFLIGTQLLLSLFHRRHQVLMTARQGTVNARIALGANLQSQGQLDPAMEQFIQCLPEPAALEALYELGLEYERRRQVNKALAVYEQLQKSTKGFRDSAQRCTRLATLSDRFPTAVASDAGRTLVLTSPVMELPVLGRYRLERELGRGAMGTVYLAKDPTISRAVAIKTLPLMEEYQGAEQREVAERFFREAEAVGRLDHPNIVTIHDAGKEHDLAYIAMDYVAGESLDSWTSKSTLLPVWEALEIAAQVADALDYAHSRNVVHRDIKPGNILYDRDSGVAKITDFGVARILDTSRTRTGTVLGSPSYMSPEQVAGKETDGRSDLFSLGTTLYQLLCGSLPFSGDSVASLMYQIANQKTPLIRKLRRGLPVCVGRLVTKALQKDAAKRFASGSAMAVAIRKCRAQFKGGRRKTA